MPCLEIVREIGPVIDSHGVQERVVVAHALFPVAAVQALDHAVHGAEQDAALAVDVALVLGLERRHERVGRAEADRPAEREVGGAAVDVLVHGEAALMPAPFTSRPCT